MAQMTFGSNRPPLLARSSVLPVDPNSPPTRPPMRQFSTAPTGRPLTDFGNLGAVQPGMSYAKPVAGGDFNRIPKPAMTPQIAPAINDLAPGATVATAPSPVGGMTATRPALRPYDPNRRRMFRDPSNR